MNNKKGMSLLGMLIAVLLIMILLKMMLPRYQKTVVKSQQQNQQTLQHVRTTLEQAEKTAAQRANPNLDF